MEVRPINTEYNGYKFRSRLEARWAIFLDEIQVPYVYEPEGFNLKGVYYLPDFQLTKRPILHEFELTKPSEIWVEVKHSPELNDDERQKIAEFVKQTDYHILLLTGVPDLNSTIQFIDHHPRDGWFFIEVRWLELPDRQIGLVPVEKLNDSQLLSQTDTPRLREAFKKAKQARFEHSGSISEVQTRIKCESCGEMFLPLYSSHSLCYNCYKKRDHNKEELVNQETSIKSVNSTKEKQKGWKKYVPVIFLIMFLFFVGIFAIYSLQNGFIYSSSSPTETATLEPTSTPPPTNTPVISLTPVCNCDRNTYDCSDFTLQTEAQACFEFCFSNFGDVHFLDNNGDRVACESLP